MKGKWKKRAALAIAALFVQGSYGYAENTTVLGSGGDSGNDAISMANAAPDEASRNLGIDITSGDKRGYRVDIRDRDGVSSVCAASTEDGEAAENTVYIENSRGYSSEETGELLDGSYLGAISVSGNVQKNEVRIYNSLLKGEIGGGRTESGNAVSNQVFLYGDELGEAGEYTLFGGWSETGQALSNYIGITKRKVGVDADSYAEAWGGYSKEQNADMNFVSIEDSEFVGYVYGGSSESGNVFANTVEIEGSSVNGEIYGGRSESGDALQNTVTIKNSQIAFEQLNDDNYTGTIYGGYSIEGTASGNQVNITDNSTVEKSVYGGYSEQQGDANNNRADIADAEIRGNVIGGFAVKGDASGNTVDIQRSTIPRVNDTQTLGFVVGGRTGDGAVHHNVVHIADSEVYGVYGANSLVYENGEKEEAKSNIVIIENSIINTTVAGALIEGRISGAAAEENIIIIKDSQADLVYGGRTQGSGTIAYNAVDISGSSRITGVWGGSNESGSLYGNTVTISGGEIRRVYGGWSVSGDAVKNTVTMSGGTVRSLVGGESSSGDAYANEVIVKGGTVTGSIYGGRSDSGKVGGNMITLTGTADVSSANIYGGYLYGDGMLFANTLILDNWSGEAASVNNIDSFVFKNVVKTDGPLLTASSAKGINEADVTLDFAGGQTFAADEKIQLVSVTGGTEAGHGETAFTAQAGIAQLISGSYTHDQNGLTATITGAELHPQTALLTSGRAVSAAFLQQGNEAVLESLRQTSVEKEAGSRTFASVWGGKNTYGIGSDAVVNGWNILAGIGTGHALSGGMLNWGVFFENGSGNYRAFIDRDGSAYRGDGSLLYNGGGVLARYDDQDGWYTEASLRAGTVKQDMTNSLRHGDAVYGYESESKYWGAHFGIGKQLQIDEEKRVDIYAKYLYAHEDSDRISIDGDTFLLDSLDSRRLRIGARWEQETNPLWKIYAGLAYEYEFSGESRMHVAGMDGEEDGAKGSTYLGEAGAVFQPAENSPWRLSLHVRGYGGERRGISGSMQAAYRF